VEDRSIKQSNNALNIVAIGGGDVGTGETLPIDRELVRLTGVPRPRLLFVPTASDDSVDYANAVAKTYSLLNCEVENLWLWGRDGSSEKARSKVERADAVYVGGGNTKRMLERWRELGVDSMLTEHLRKGKPAGGVSAGAICWFGVCNSDWPQYDGIPGVNTAPLQCLGLIDLSLCPHTAREGFRLGEFRAMMSQLEGKVGIGLDDCCALQVSDDRWRILSSVPQASAHRIAWQDGVLYESRIAARAEFAPLAALTDFRENGTRIARLT
jgi:dipeptidase E